MGGYERYVSTQTGSPLRRRPALRHTLFLRLRFLGRVEEDGTLMCSYHGWRFNESGKCVKIPQADDEKSHEAACNNPRSAVKTFPCQSRGGILWIWPDASESAYVDSAVTPFPVPDDYLDALERKALVGQTPGFTSLVPYNYDVLMENILDPSHLPFSHHGAMPGMDRSKGTSLKMQISEPSLPGATDAVDYSTGPDGIRSRRLERMGPNASIALDPQTAEGVSRGGLIFLVCAIKDGQTRIFTLTIAPGALTGNQPPTGFLFKLLLTHFRWIAHMFGQNILCGDNVFLHGQDAHLRHPNMGPWSPKLYYLPTSADVSISRFRNWLSREGGGGPFGHVRDELPSGTLKREELLDRYSSHVVDCRECQKGLKLVKRLMSVFQALSYGFLLIAGFVMVQAIQQGMLSKWKLAVSLASCALCAYLERFLKTKVLPLFYFQDYVHAEKN